MRYIALMRTATFGAMGPEDASISHPVGWKGRLTRLGERLLRRLGAAPVYFERKEYQYSCNVPALPPRIQEILKQRLVCQQLWHAQVDTLICSPLLWDKMIRDTMSLNPISYRESVLVGYGQERRFCNLNVVVLPWIDGWILVDSKLLRSVS